MSNEVQWRTQEFRSGAGGGGGGVQKIPRGEGGRGVGGL